MTIGELLKQARERVGLTQAAASIATGISQGNVSDYENGKLSNPSLDILLRFAAAYQTTVSKLTKGLGQEKET